MLELNREGRVAVLRINSPKTKNALTGPVIEALIEHLAALGEDDDARVTIFTGAPPMFTSGMDVRCLADHRSPESQRILLDLVPRMLRAFIDFPKPLIAAVNGPGIGFGATVCGLADVTLMSASAKLKAPFASMSVVPEAASTATFPRLMGWQAASWTMLGGEWLDAPTCVRLGLALEAYPDDQLMHEVMRRAQVIASAPLQAILSTKALLNRTRKAQLHEANHAELEAFHAMMNEPSFVEAMTAMKERRVPDFSQF